jgi:hypothetical protein
MIDKPNIYILIDNKGIIRFFLQMQARSSQVTALRINLLLLDLFSRNPRLKLHFSHCPSYTGVPFNEKVDRLATTFNALGGIPQGSLRQHFLDDKFKVANQQWQALAHLRSQLDGGMPKEVPLQATDQKQRHEASLPQPCCQRHPYHDPADMLRHRKRAPNVSPILKHTAPIAQELTNCLFPFSEITRRPSRLTTCCGMYIRYFSFSLRILPTLYIRI